MIWYTFCAYRKGTRIYGPTPGKHFCMIMGAFRLFNGPKPASVTPRCREYAELAEGRLWRMEKKPAPREGGWILQSMDFLFRAIAEPSRNCPPVDLEDTGVAPDAHQRGIKRRRPWLELPGDIVANSPGDMDEKEAPYALRDLSLD